MKEYRFFTLITAIFVAVVLISNVASSKWVSLGPFTFDGGTILFPLSYIFGDILTEVYGYRKSRQVIWTGFGCALLMALVFATVGRLPPAAGWEGQAAYETILGTTPRIVVGSVVAYFAGEFSNSFTLAKMKIFTRGRWLFTRTIGSTIIGEGVDTLLFIVIAFAGTLPWNLLLAGIVSNYIFKVAVEITATPATYAIVGYLKRVEHTDVYDYGTDFNPFARLWNLRRRTSSSS
ncbi:MAG: queuosine precursor transporter [Dehalococcoidales bacterium]|nr:queuosine precursor transporter [Dehalococcoidales bacterium]